jgi:RNA polymerase sigma factor (sigma-70 family)
LTSDTEIKTLSDEEIILRYRENSDKRLVGELYKRYTRFVFLVSLKYLKNEERSQDAVMQIFEKLFTDFKRHDIEKFKPWLHTVTRNHCLVILRKDQSVQLKAKKFQQDAESFMENDTELHLDKADDPEKQLEYMKEAMQDLGYEQKICIEMFYLQEKSYKEIADTTGFTEKNVKSYIQNGKRNLKLKILKMTSATAILLFLWLGLRF